jgi:3-hydroxybutyrate dehydrogenase
MMPGRVDGKGIVITGAANGMGRAFTFAFASEGGHVGVLDRDEAGAERVAEEIRDRAGGPAIAPALFLTSADSDYLTGRVLMADGGMVLV